VAGLDSGMQSSCEFYLYLSEFEGGTVGVRHSRMLLSLDFPRDGEVLRTVENPDETLNGHRDKNIRGAT
jgi:hypothetical protein